jgi:Tol biopolymer transport system component
MGEVYRARDTRLDRDVAIKVLPPHLSSNPQFRDRFEREAKAISQLNHPHICTLHDVGFSDGTSYLVMELLEGESLADRIGKGPLPLSQVLRYGTEIATALDKAHRQGIVHRDLKPGNIMITKSGAKLLDFGLAKSMIGSMATTAVAPFDATQQKPLTAEGTVLGTLQYMAPEQLAAEEADARTDIFALGTVLYEMTTGRRAFDGATRTSLIASILSAEPVPISRVQPLTPPALEHVVRKCLEKERDDRWQSAHDIADQLRWLGDAGSQAGVAAPVISRRRTREAAAWAVAALATVAAIALGLLLWRKPAEAPRVLRAAVTAPPGHQLEYGRLENASLTLSPNGRFVTFSATDKDGTYALWVRPLDSDQARIVAIDAFSPFWSPDSRSIGFFTDGKLKRVDVSGGPATILADAPDGRGGTWNRDGTIVFEPEWRMPLHRVSASGGGKSTAISKIDDRTETTHRWPWFLPDGKHFLYLAATHKDAASNTDGIYVGSLDSPERKLIARGRSNAMFVSGHLLLPQDNWLVAQPFDPEKLELTGEPRRVAENVTYDSGFFRSAFAASESGDLAYFTGAAMNSAQIVALDRKGKELRKIGEPLPLLMSDIYQSLRLSPNEKLLALEVGDPADIWLVDIERSTRTRFTTEAMSDASPVWSPDGRKILYFNDKDVYFSILQKDVGGFSRETNLLTDKERLMSPTGISSDGRYAAMEAADPAAPLTSIDIWMLPLTGADRKPFPFVESQFVDRDGQFSPDGRWLTYTSNESGRAEVYAVSFPSRDVKQQITSTGATTYSWRADGREIVYMTPDRTVMAMAVNGDTFEAPVVLFKSPVPILAGEITRDGKQIFAVVGRPRDAASIHLVTNWPAALPK